MNLMQISNSRRSATIATALFGVLSLAIGAHAALNKQTSVAPDVVSVEQSVDLPGKASRVALVIGNSQYPDADGALMQPINDARGLTTSLRRDGFDVEVVEDASKDDMERAIGRLKSKIRQDSVVMVFFGGYGIQAGNESYMIPVDAAIWKETDVRRDGISIESVLEMMKAQGACAKLVVIDAARRNPYERRFRAYSHGLAPIDTPDNALILTSTMPGKVADDASGQNSTLMSELLNNLSAQQLDKTAAETLFENTRLAVARASEGEQVPSLSGSLQEDVSFGVSENVGG
jgi:uncharacterized caspase-like protein